MTRQTTRPTTGRRDSQTTPADVAARYAENLRRLARDAGKMGRPALANSLLSVADLMDDMVDEIATDERGLYVLRRVCRLIGGVERLLSARAKAPILH